jgi:hypothetical protein
MLKTMTLAGVAIVALTPALALAATPRHVALTEAQAKTDIELDGYAKIENLHQANNGWMANATEDGKPVTLIVNDLGVKKL